MTGPVDELFGLTVPHGELLTCIPALEDGLRSIKESAYHAVLGRDFLHHTDDAAALLADFYRGSTAKGPIAAIYCEMNGFTINPDRWYFNGFGYIKGGSVWDLTWNRDWLCPWDYQTHEITLTGMELVQQAFERHYCDEECTLGIALAGQVAEYLVVARFNELICAAHQAAKSLCPSLAGVPVFSTAHEWDALCPST